MTFKFTRRGEDKAYNAHERHYSSHEHKSYNPYDAKFVKKWNAKNTHLENRYLNYSKAHGIQKQLPALHKFVGGSGLFNTPFGIYLGGRKRAASKIAFHAAVSRAEINRRIGIGLRKSTKFKNRKRK